MPTYSKMLTNFSLAAGICLISLLPLGLTAGTGSAAFLIAFVLHLALLLSALFFAISSFAGLAKEAFSNKQKYSTSISIFCLALFALLITAQSLLPITARDALIHHLAVPKWWLESGRIVPIDWHEWSYYPMLLQLAFTGLLSQGLEAATPFYHFIYLILLAASSACFVHSKMKNATLSLFSGTLLFTLPVCLNLASTPLVDLGLAFYFAIACFSFANWLDEQNDTELLIAGLAAGLSLGCKPNAMLACALLFPLFFLAALRSKVSLATCLRALLIAGIVALGVFLPWMLRNYSWTGNPLYPMLKSVFSEQALSYAGAPVGLTPLQQRFMLYKEGWLEVLLLPLRIFVSGQDDNPALFDGRLSPLLLLSFLWLWSKQKQTWASMLFSFSLLYLIFALFLTGARVRYMIPIIAPLAVLTSLGINALLEKGAKLSIDAMCTILLLIQLILSSWYANEWLSKSDTLKYFLSQQSKEAYLSSHLAEYPIIRYINSNTAADSRIYLLFTGNRFYYFNRPLITAGYMSGNAIISWTKACADATCLAEKFHQSGANYLLAHANRTASTFGAALSDKEKAIWNSFQSGQGEIVYSANGYVLWKLK